MYRTALWLPLSLIRALKAESKRTGAPMAEIIRRAVAARVTAPASATGGGAPRKAGPGGSNLARWSKKKRHA